MTYEEFMSIKPHEKYTSVDLEYIIKFLKRNKDVCFELDVRVQGKESAKVITEKIIKLAKNDNDILERILMQFISEDA